NHGTAVGKVSYTPGRVGLAFRFSGTDQVEVAGAPDLDLTTAVTMEAWIKPTSLFFDGSYGALIAKGSGTRRSYSLFLSSQRTLPPPTPGTPGVPWERGPGAPPAAGNSPPAPGHTTPPGGAWKFSAAGRRAVPAAPAGPLVPNPQPLTIGLSDKHGFYGLIDEP